MNDFQRLEDRKALIKRLLAITEEEQVSIEDGICNCKSCTDQYLPIDHPRTPSFWKEFDKWWSTPNLLSVAPCNAMTYPELRVYGIEVVSARIAEGTRVQNKCKMVLPRAKRGRIDAQECFGMPICGLNEDEEISHQRESTEQNVDEPQEQHMELEEEETEVQNDALVSVYQTDSSMSATSHWVKKENSQIASRTEEQEKTDPLDMMKHENNVHLSQVKEDVQIIIEQSDDLMQDVHDGKKEEEKIENLQIASSESEEKHQGLLYVQQQIELFRFVSTMKLLSSSYSDADALTCPQCSYFMGEQPIHCFFEGSVSCPQCGFIHSESARVMILSQVLDRINHENRYIEKDFTLQMQQDVGRVFIAPVHLSWSSQKRTKESCDFIPVNSFFFPKDRRRSNDGEFFVNCFSIRGEQRQFTHYRVMKYQLQIGISSIYRGLNLYHDHGSSIPQTIEIPTFESLGHQKQVYFF